MGIAEGNFLLPDGKSPSIPSGPSSATSSVSWSPSQTFIYPTVVSSATYITCPLAFQLAIFESYYGGNSNIFVCWNNLFNLLYSHEHLKWWGSIWCSWREANAGGEWQMADGERPLAASQTPSQARWHEQWRGLLSRFLEDKFSLSPMLLWGACYVFFIIDHKATRSVMFKGDGHSAMSRRTRPE